MSVLQVSGPKTPNTSSGGTPVAAVFSAAGAPPAQPDLLDVLLSHQALHEPRVVAKLHLTSRYMSARLATALAGCLKLSFVSCSTESVLSLSLWLHQHAALLSSLEVGVKVCCCPEDEAAADKGIADALTAAATHAPNLRMQAFSTTYSQPKLLALSCRTLPSLQHLVALSVPDLTTDSQIHSLPRSLTSLEITKSTSNASRLQLISQQCPRLQQVRIGYSLWPSRTNAGSQLLDHALNGWVLLPLVEMRFNGCRLPRYRIRHELL